VPNLIITVLGGGAYAILGDDVLGRPHQIQFVEGLSVANWQSPGTATGNASGIFQFIASNGMPRRFNRTVFP
jgi:hypothetical protein